MDDVIIDTASLSIDATGVQVIYAMIVLKKNVP